MAETITKGVADYFGNLKATDGIQCSVCGKCDFIGNASAAGWVAIVTPDTHVEGHYDTNNPNSTTAPGGVNVVPGSVIVKCADCK